MRAGCTLIFSFDRYPIIIGDFAKIRVALLKDWLFLLLILKMAPGSSEHRKKIEVMDVIRKNSRRIKEFGTAKFIMVLQERAGPQEFHRVFLGGSSSDGEGSSIQKSGNPPSAIFFCGSHERQKSLICFRKYLRNGNVRRSKRRFITIMKSIIHKYLKNMQVIPHAIPLLRHARQRERMANFNGSSTTTRRIPHFQKCGNDMNVLNSMAT